MDCLVYQRAEKRGSAEWWALSRGGPRNPTRESLAPSSRRRRMQKDATWGRVLGGSPAPSPRLAAEGAGLLRGARPSGASHHLAVGWHRGTLSRADASGRRLLGLVNVLAGNGWGGLVVPVFVHDVAVAVKLAAVGGHATAARRAARSAARVAAVATVARRAADNGLPQACQRAGAAAARADEIAALIARIALVWRIANPLAPITLAAATTSVATAVQPIFDAPFALAARQAARPAARARRSTTWSAGGPAAGATSWSTARSASGTAGRAAAKQHRPWATGAAAASAGGKKG